MRLRFVAAAIAAITIGAAGAAAQAPNPGNYSPAVHDVVEERGHLVTMRDGVRLSVDVYRPAGAERFPGVLTITPYDNTGPRERARWFARRGYVAVLADSRGRYDSEGEWDPFIVEHKTDGYDLVEWIAAQPWCNGSVGMVGGSYLGWTQWWTASQAPPSLKAIAPAVAPPDAFSNIPYQQGIMLGPFVDWAAWMSGRTAQIKDEGPYGGFTNTRWEDLLHAPYITLDEARGMKDGGWWKSWINGYLASDPYWDGMEYQSPESFARMTVPALNLTGWFDADFPGSPINYAGMKAHGATAEARRPGLLIGPWFHGLNDRVVAGIDYGPEAQIDLDGYITRWFDHFLKGIDNGVTEDPRVHVFVMGPNRWFAHDDWPLPGTIRTDLHLASGGHANSSLGATVRSNGTLSRRTVTTRTSMTPTTPPPPPTATTDTSPARWTPANRRCGTTSWSTRRPRCRNRWRSPGPSRPSSMRPPPLATPTGWCGCWTWGRTVRRCSSPRAS